MEGKLYNTYVAILKEELIPAMGCTEPIAVAFAAAKAREILGQQPDRVLLKASGNIIKNVKSVIVPNTGGMKGLEAAAAIGIVAGDAAKGLEVISQVTEDQKEEMKHFLESPGVAVVAAESDFVFDIWLYLFRGTDEVLLRIVEEHTNIVLIEKNGETLYQNNVEEKQAKLTANLLTVSNIYQFSNTCDLDDIKDIIKRQIDYNTAISEEGLRGDWGANIGKTILNYEDNISVHIRAKAKAAAGSDARMSGCELPVVINSGSGNQGITVSVPVIEYAKELGSSEEKLYRALVFANLLGLHQKAGIGRLSAYCGAVSAGCAAGAGIAYLQGCSLEQISHLIVNCLAIASGIVCDGAKPSCAAKIAASIDSAILAYNMMIAGEEFKAGEGIVKKGVENTIREVSSLGRNGMRETDTEIIRIMTSV